MWAPQQSASDALPSRIAKPETIRIVQPLSISGRSQTLCIWLDNLCKGTLFGNLAPKRSRFFALELYRMVLVHPDIGPYMCQRIAATLFQHSEVHIDLVSYLLG